MVSRIPMNGKQHSPEQSFRKLRSAEQFPYQGQSLADSVVSCGYRPRPTTPGSSWAEG